MKVIKVDDVEVYRITCGWCCRSFYALTEEEAKRMLIEHLNEYHS